MFFWAVWRPADRGWCCSVVADTSSGPTRWHTCQRTHRWARPTAAGTSRTLAPRPETRLTSERTGLLLGVLELRPRQAPQTSERPADSPHVCDLEAACACVKRPAAPADAALTLADKTSCFRLVLLCGASGRIRSESTNSSHNTAALRRLCWSFSRLCHFSDPAASWWTDLMFSCNLMKKSLTAELQVTCHLSGIFSACLHRFFTHIRTFFIQDLFSWRFWLTTGSSEQFRRKRIQMFVLREFYLSSSRWNIKEYQRICGSEIFSTKLIQMVTVLRSPTLLKVKHPNLLGKILETNVLLKEVWRSGSAAWWKLWSRSCSINPSLPLHRHRFHISELLTQRNGQKRVWSLKMYFHCSPS